VLVLVTFLLSDLICSYSLLYVLSFVWYSMYLFYVPVLYIELALWLLCQYINDTNLV